MNKRIIDKNLLKKLRRRAELQRSHKEYDLPNFEKPIFVVSAPRAGSTLLFEILSQFPDVWSTGEENHELIERITELHPRAKNYDSNALTKKDYTPEIAEKLHKRFGKALLDRDRGRYLDLSENNRPSKIRFIEKTPKNALRIPFLKAVFPDALFIFLYSA